MSVFNLPFILNDAEYLFLTEESYGKDLISDWCFLRGILMVEVVLAR